MVTGTPFAAACNAILSARTFDFSYSVQNVFPGCICNLEQFSSVTVCSVCAKSLIDIDNSNKLAIVAVLLLIIIGLCGLQLSFVTT
jgi:hypothetical protein